MQPRRQPGSGRATRWVAPLAVLLGAWLAVFGAAAAPADAGVWLARLQQAANLGNYQGTMVFSAGGVVSSSHVAHFRDGDQDFERVEALDGRMHRVYRHNDAVLTLWPQSRIAVQDRREPLAGLWSPMAPLEARALEQYSLKPLGTERIAGRDAQVVMLVPRDAYRYPQRFWTDLATGLMLRVDVLGPGREVLESAAFSEVEIGIRPQPDTVLVPMRHLDGYRVLRRPESATRLEAEGWALASPVAGFRLANCLKRPLPGDAPEAAGASPVLQAVFSDGLTHVSLFVENFDPARHLAPLHTRIGATSTLMQRQGEAWWLTAIGDVPLATLHQFAAALERRR